MDDRELDELAGGWRRALSTARLTGKLGAKAAGRVLFGKKKDPADDGVAAARQLVARMGQLKGLVMKAGQIASYMPGALPPAATTPPRRAALDLPAAECHGQAEAGQARAPTIEPEAVRGLRYPEPRASVASLLLARAPASVASRRCTSIL